MLARLDAVSPAADKRTQASLQRSPTGREGIELQAPSAAMSKLVALLKRAGAGLDALYATSVHAGLHARFFARGWGDLASLDRIAFGNLLREVQESPRSWPAASPAGQAAVPTVSWRLLQSGPLGAGDGDTGDTGVSTTFEYFEGEFESPAARGRLPGLPRACERGRVWLLRPAPSAAWPSGMRACVIQLPATGEHTDRCAAASTPLPRSRRPSLVPSSCSARTTTIRMLPEAKLPPVALMQATVQSASLTSAAVLQLRA